MLTLLTWLLVGLVVGTAAKLIMPGRDPGGLVITLCIGLAGSFIGGYAGSLLGVGSVSGFDVESLALATAGAVILLAAYRLIRF